MFVQIEVVSGQEVDVVDTVVEEVAVRVVASVDGPTATDTAIVRLVDNRSYLVLLAMNQVCQSVKIFWM